MQNDRSTSCSAVRRALRNGPALVQNKVLDAGRFQRSEQIDVRLSFHCKVGQRPQGQRGIGKIACHFVEIETLGDDLYVAAVNIRCKFERAHVVENLRLVTFTGRLQSFVQLLDSDDRALDELPFLHASVDRIFRNVRFFILRVVTVAGVLGVIRSSVGRFIDTAVGTAADKQYGDCE